MFFRRGLLAIDVKPSQPRRRRTQPDQARLASCAPSSRSASAARGQFRPPSPPAPPIDKAHARAHLAPQITAGLGWGRAGGAPNLVKHAAPHGPRTCSSSRAGRRSSRRDDDVAARGQTTWRTCEGSSSSYPGSGVHLPRARAASFAALAASIRDRFRGARLSADRAWGRQSSVGGAARMNPLGLRRRAGPDLPLARARPFSRSSGASVADSPKLCRWGLETSWRRRWRRIGGQTRPQQIGRWGPLRVGGSPSLASSTKLVLAAPPSLSSPSLQLSPLSLPRSSPPALPPSSPAPPRSSPSFPSFSTTTSSLSRHNGRRRSSSYWCQGGGSSPVQEAGVLRLRAHHLALLRESLSRLLSPGVPPADASQPRLQLWGISYGLIDVLNSKVQKSFGITKLQSTMLQVAYFGAYLVFSMCVYSSAPCTTRRCWRPARRCIAAVDEQ